MPIKDSVPSKYCLKYLFNNDVITSLDEADDEIAVAAKKHDAIGILAQDSDFMIYQTGEEGPQIDFY